MCNYIYVQYLLPFSAADARAWPPGTQAHSSGACVTAAVSSVGTESVAGLCGEGSSLRRHVAARGTPQSGDYQTSKYTFLVILCVGYL